jgi:acetyl-CoA acyltransferase
MIPMGGNKISPNPWLVDHYPDAYLSMGLTAERLAQRFGITREQADEFSLRSHKNAVAAIQAGRFADETVPVPVSFTTPNGSKPKRHEIIFKADEGPRADTSLEALLALKPAFHAKGTVTAGNSSQMSDGAAAAIVMSADRAKALGIKPLARYVSFATAGYKPEEMGLGPVFAIPKALKLAGLKLSDIDVIELNEAFAAQSLAVIKEAGLDPERVNPNGGAIALGHPLGCTGAKLTATIIRELQRRHARYDHVRRRRNGSGWDFREPGLTLLVGSFVYLRALCGFKSGGSFVYLRALCGSISEGSFVYLRALCGSKSEASFVCLRALCGFKSAPTTKFHEGKNR